MKFYLNISGAIISVVCTGVIRFRRLTISDGIERSLRKGRSEEQGAAATLAPLLCVQLGVGEASEEICRNLKPILLTVATDKSVSPVARAKVSKS